jgi:hypothetical protein
MNFISQETYLFTYSTIASTFLLCLLTASKTVFRETSSAGPSLSLKSDAQNKWRSEGNKIQFNSNTENMEDLIQALWAIDNTKIDYARFLP